MKNLLPSASMALVATLLVITSSACCPDGETCRLITSQNDGCVKWFHLDQSDSRLFYQLHGQFKLNQCGDLVVINNLGNAVLVSGKNGYAPATSRGVGGDLVFPRENLLLVSQGTECLLHPEHRN